MVTEIENQLNYYQIENLFQTDRTSRTQVTDLIHAMKYVFMTMSDIKVL
jgi:hypothetical protein